MRFGGFQPLTLTDFPGRTACIVFTQGCNLRCGYCHNARLIGLQAAAGEAAAPTESELSAFLEKRRGMLDGVVISGGEPTIQAELPAFLARIKAMGFAVKLDTNGTNPTVLREILSRRFADYVAMDVKHDPARYAEAAGVCVDPAALAESRDWLRASGVAYEFRTTVLPRLHDDAAMEQIARFCEGSPRLVLQRFRPEHAFDPAQRCDSPTTLEQIRRFRSIAERFLGRVATPDAADDG